MNNYCRTIVTFLLGFLAFVKTQICDLDCGPRYRCALRRSSCQYPPCPSFPTCALFIPELSVSDQQRHEGRHTKSLQRHRQSFVGSVLSTSGIPAWADPSNERPGQCPSSASTGPCINSCRMDTDCPLNQKCCENDCGKTCRAIVNDNVEKPGTCARRLESILGTCQRECENDLDCPGVQKCCTTSCAAICSDPCYYWLEPNQRSNRKSVIWKLPFICRI